MSRHPCRKACKKPCWRPGSDDPEIFPGDSRVLVRGRIRGVSYTGGVVYGGCRIRGVSYTGGCRIRGCRIRGLVGQKPDWRLQPWDLGHQEARGRLGAAPATQHPQTESESLADTRWSWTARYRATLQWNPKPAGGCPIWRAVQFKSLRPPHIETLMNRHTEDNEAAPYATVSREPTRSRASKGSAWPRHPHLTRCTRMLLG